MNKSIISSFFVATISFNFTFGDTVKFYSKLYKNCTGIIAQVDDGTAIVRSVQCDDIDFTFMSVKLNRLIKIRSR